MPDYCLICHSEISPQTGWIALISEEKEQTLCPTCKGKLEEINGPACVICNRPLNQLDPRFVCEQTCYDCIRWEEGPQWQGCLLQNQSIFHYNAFLQEVIARYKFRGDYILAKIFSESIQHKLTNEHNNNTLLVPIPLSPERLRERGFNQAEALILETGLQPANILTRIHTEKQSKKSRTERIHVPQVFQLQPNTTLAGKNILLFDDIYTTGSTLHHAAKLLMTNGAAAVSAITIARG